MLDKMYLVCIISCLFQITAFAQVGIGTITPDASAILDVESTTRGFLPPRLTTAERDAINSGVATPGLLIYNKDIKCIEIYNGTTWINFCNSSGSTTTPPPNIDAIPFGDANLSTHYCFDIAESNNLTQGTGNLILRKLMRSDFGEASTNTKTLTFKSTTNVSNLTFYAEDESGLIISTFTPTSDYSNVGSLTEATAEIVYKTSLSSPDPESPTNGAALGKTSKEALRPTFYVVYNDDVNGTGSEVKLQISPIIKDSQCGGETKRSIDGPHFFLNDIGESYAFGLNLTGGAQLGSGSTLPASNNSGYEPNYQKTAINTAIVSISKGSNGTAFIDALGRLYIVEGVDNGYNLPNIGNGIPNLVPLSVTKPVVKVVGAHGKYFFQTADDSIFAFGNVPNLDGQLGVTEHSNIAEINAPLPVNTNLPAGVKIIDFDAGWNSVMLWCDDGKIYTAGKQSTNGRGEGTAVDIATPNEIFHPIDLSAIGSDVVDIESTTSGGLILFANGDVYGYGYDVYRALGPHPFPPQIDNVYDPYKLTSSSAGFNNIIKVWANRGSIYYLTADGQLWSAGLNGFGQSGKGIVTAGQNGFIGTIGKCVNMPAGVTPVDMHVMTYAAIFIGNDGKYYSAGRSYAPGQDNYLIYESCRADGVPATPVSEFHEIETPAYHSSTENWITY
ncbi:MAG: hypothetical protein ACPGSD_13400 [Flavobacteriales bacterium]